MMIMHEIAWRQMGLFLEGILRERGKYEEITAESWVLAKGKSLDIFLGCFFQDEDVIQDRFVVHLKPYRDIRELLAEGVITGNVEDIAAAVTVRISTIILI